MANIENIVIDQGSTFTTIFTITQLTTPSLPWNATTNPYIPVVFTGYTAHLQVRKTFDSPTALIDLTNSSGIALGSNGQVTITITPTQSNSVTFAGDRVVMYYDLLLTNSSGSTRVVEGTATFKRSITR